MLDPECGIWDPHLALPLQSKKRTKSVEGRISFGLICCAGFIAPVAGGSTNVWMTPVLSVLGYLAFVASLLACRRQGRSIALPLMTFGFVGLSVFTLAQSLSLPMTVLEWISPKAHEIRSFVHPELSSGQISYEAGLSAREATKLLIYGLLAYATLERFRARRTAYRFTLLTLGAILATIAGGAFHRLFGLEKIFGILTSSTEAYKLYSTFVNVNHASAFSAWGALIALGLALEEPKRKNKAGLLIVAAFCVIACVSMPSRGGILVLGLGLTGFLIAMRWSGRKNNASVSNTIVGALVLVGSITAIFQSTLLKREFDDGLGLEAKLGAVRGASKMIQDHLWFGIGKGSYTSLFSHYKTSTEQFTYTHPENFVIQYLTDWGVLVGGLVVIALILTLTRSLKALQNPSSAGVLIGICVIGLQNIFDFSFEIAGFVIPVLIAFVAHSSHRSLFVKKISATSNVPFALILIVPLVILITSNYFTFSKGVIEHDLKFLQNQENTKRVEQHPANSTMATLMAFHAESANPPKLKDALRWANIALYLSPAYADAHWVVGRLLLRAGIRSQGFEQIRVAWQRTPQSFPSNYFSYIDHFAQAPEDYLEAVPRRNFADDIPDERYLIQIIRWLVSNKKPLLARELTKEFPKPSDVTKPEILKAIAWSYYYTKQFEQALEAISIHRELTQDKAALRKLKIKCLQAVGEYSEAIHLLRQAMDDSPHKRVALLFQTTRMAIDYGTSTTAKSLIDELELVAPPTDLNRSRIIRLRLKHAMKDQKPGEALELLDRIIQNEPSAVDLRMMRAQIHTRAQRYRKALVDVEAVLNLNPSHPGAIQLQNRIRINP
ncbi:MAG: tetratricopeptide repeat protein [Myxococcota bacterium]|nr:tetratricopeptide repeat protein [Myxococcota bacterium]